MPEHGARRLFLEVEQIQFLADAAMIALLRLFEAGRYSLSCFSLAQAVP